MDNDYQLLIDSLLIQENVLITGHRDPDGDCVGTMLALYFAFDGKKKNWQLILDGDIPDNLSYLPGIELINKPEASSLPAAVFLVDCSDIERAGEEWLLPYWPKASKYILDHHLNCQAEGDIIIQESSASAAGEIAYRVINQAGLALNSDIAVNLYTAIVSDTGGFRYSNVTPEVFNIASRLLESGINLEKIRVNLFEQRSRTAMAILGAAISSLEYYHNNEIAFMTIDKQIIEKHGAKREDCKEIINYTMMPKGVKAGVLFEEQGDDIRVGLRCRDKYDVNKIASSFGGGGHALAAGCVFNNSALDDVKQKVLNEVSRMLDNK